MFDAKPEFPHKSVLQIKHDDKFFCRLLSKETSMSNSSFRVNIGVPFVWESQPGTPKYTFSEDTLPPLTPPPSYHFNTVNACKKPQKKKSSRSNLLLALLPKMNLKKIILSSSSTSSLSSSYSSLSSPSSDSSKLVCRRRKRFLSFGSSFDFKGDNEENGATSPTSILCFGIPRTTRGN